MQAASKGSGSIESNGDKPACRDTSIYEHFMHLRTLGVEVYHEMLRTEMTDNTRNLYL